MIIIAQAKLWGCKFESCIVHHLNPLEPQGSEGFFVLPGQSETPAPTRIRLVGDGATISANTRPEKKGIAAAP